jgi:hypothetical protein
VYGLPAEKVFEVHLPQVSKALWFANQLFHAGNGLAGPPGLITKRNDLLEALAPYRGKRNENLIHRVICGNPAQ